MRLAAVVPSLLALLFLECVFSQETCNGGMVGFTALTPDQLREEIRKTIKDDLEEFLDGVTEREAEEEMAYLAAVSRLLSSVGGVNESVASLQREVVGQVTAAVEGVISRRLQEAVANLTLAFREELAALGGIPPPTSAPATPTTPPPPTVSTSFPPPPPGFAPSSPAQSCQHVQEAVIGGVPSGRYWITNPETNTPVYVFCDMTRSCGNLTGGWMRVADIDMRVPSHQCPGDFVEITRSEPPSRLCTPDSEEMGCFSYTFPVMAGYRHVCGRVQAYQDRTPNAFFNSHIDTSLTIDSVYMDGISLTHGIPRSHVWTFAAALDEATGHSSGCVCSNVNIDPADLADVPPFVGTDYFCDTGSRNDVELRFYEADPLWDGQGCGPDSTCCSYNNPPWFFRRLASSTSDDLEMRVCRNSGIANENIPFEVVELYVR